jgi:hypothetical protein
VNTSSDFTTQKRKVLMNTFLKKYNRIFDIERNHKVLIFLLFLSNILRIKKKIVFNMYGSTKIEKKPTKLKHTIQINNQIFLSKYDRNKSIDRSNSTSIEL